MPLKFSLFDKREKKRESRVSQISQPVNLEHKVHVGFDNQTGTLQGLPAAWEQMLKDSFTPQEQKANPKALINAINFLPKAMKLTDDNEPKYLYSAGSMSSIEILDEVVPLEQEPRSGAKGSPTSGEPRPFAPPSPGLSRDKGDRSGAARCGSTPVQPMDPTQGVKALFIDSHAQRGASPGPHKVSAGTAPSPATTPLVVDKEREKEREKEKKPLPLPPVYSLLLSSSPPLLTPLFSSRSYRSFARLSCI